MTAPDTYPDIDTTVRAFTAALHGCGWHAERAWQQGNHQAMVAALAAAVRDGWEPAHLARKCALGLATYPTPNAAAVLLSRLRRAAGHDNQEEGD